MLDHQVHRTLHHPDRSTVARLDRCRPAPPGLRIPGRQVQRSTVRLAQNKLGRQGRHMQDHRAHRNIAHRVLRNHDNCRGLLLKRERA
jgi:hypothetical protein